eukprot:scaffold190672_cov44-Prasinocladus_malaysianus.AAC.1
MDSDEFLLLHERYKSVHGFIHAKERQFNTDQAKLGAISFRWLIGNNLAPSCSDRPMSELISSSQLWPHHLLKTITRVEAVEPGDADACHFLPLQPGYTVLFEEEIHSKPTKTHSVGRSTRYLTNDYAMLHLETRSLSSIVAKALVPSNPINQASASSALPKCDGSFDTFVHALGRKAHRPAKTEGCLPNIKLVRSKLKHGKCKAARPSVNAARLITLSPMNNDTIASRLLTSDIPACNRSQETASTEHILRLHGIEPSVVWHVLDGVSKDLHGKAKMCCP